MARAFGQHARRRLRGLPAGADFRRNRHFERRARRTTLSQARGDVSTTQPNPQHPLFR